MQQRSKINSESVLLFTGGAKGITAQCAIELAKMLPCTYVLMGRSHQQSEPDWANGISDPSALKAAAAAQLKARGEKVLPAHIENEYRAVVSAREIEETLKEIRNEGAQAFYISTDVTEEEQVLTAVKQFEVESGKLITGLVHGAGRLADKRIERKSAADFDAVYGTKVGGLWNVLHALNADKLELLVLFSSVAGTFGNVGQADYAMANEVLNKTAYQFQKTHPACQVLSINWGPWDSGMVTEELKKAFAGMGIVLISMEEGVRHFVNEVIADSPETPQIVIGSAIKRHPESHLPKMRSPIRVKRVIDPARNPFLLDHQIGENRVLPATCAAAWMADTCEMIFPSYRFFRLENYRVFKGLVFSDDRSFEYIAEVNFESAQPVDEVHCLVRILTEGDRPLLHYQADIVLKPNHAFPTRPIVSQGLVATDSSEQSASHYYTEKILFHGPAFQGLKAVTQMDTSHLSSISHLQKVDGSTQGQFTVRATNPYMNDVILQGLLVWTYLMDQAVCLPSGIQRLEQYAILPFDQDCYVQATVTAHTVSSIRADAVVTDAQGKLYLRVEGVEGTISKMLLPLFQASHTSLDVLEEKKLETERTMTQG